MIFLLVAVFAVLVLLEAPGMIKNKNWRALTVYSVLMTLAFVICIMYILDIDVPNPVKNTQYYIKSLFPFSYD